MPAVDQPLAEVLDYSIRDDSSDMEVDSSVLPSFAKRTAMPPSFTKTTATPPSFTEIASIHCPPVPIGHSSMADTSMPSLDDLDSVPLPSFQVPDQPSENTIEDSLPVNGILHETPAVQYTIVHSGSKFGNDMLTDSRGYSYSEKHMKGIAAGVRNWQCTKCSICKAKVCWEGNSTFIFNGPDHLCTAQPGIATTLCIKQQIKSTALQNIFTSAAEITKSYGKISPVNLPLPFLHPSTSPGLLTDTTSAFGQKIPPAWTLN